LADGEQTDANLSEQFDFSDLTTVGELMLAVDAGWVTTCLAGIGGLFARPPMLYELTNRGREVLTWSP
jgi:hypothetical protein